MQRTLKTFTTLLASMLLASMLATSASAQEASPVVAPAAADLEGATAWLMRQQLEDGGFPGFSGETDPSITVDAIIALSAAAHRGIDTQAAIDTSMTYLESGDIALVYAQTGQGQAAKLVLAAAATGNDPHDIAGVDPLALITQPPTADNGLYGNGVFDHALVILALVATGTDVPADAIASLETAQTPEGGWAFDGSTGEGAADSNTTALVVQALAAAGETDSPIVGDAMAYLLSTLDGANGAVYQPGADLPADANSTAFVIQAVLAVGDDPASDGWGNLPAALAGFQNTSGAFHFNEQDMSDNAYSTVQAIPAVAGLALPISPVADMATPISWRLDTGLLMAA